MASPLVEAAPLIQSGAARYFFNDDTFVKGTFHDGQYKHLKA